MKRNVDGSKEMEVPTSGSEALERKTWVDPASGWQYGFPAVWDPSKETLDELMDRHNYPKDMRNLWVRYWDYTEEEKEDDSGAKDY